MDDSVRALQERTDAKLRYAGVHLTELRNQGTPNGGDFDKAHQESFLFHLLGVRDALLAELNHYYSAGLQPNALSPGKLQSALKRAGSASTEVAKLYALDQDDTSWFSRAKSFRDHSAHVQGVARAYHLGGPNHQKVKLKDPRTGEVNELHFVDEFVEFEKAMHHLVLELRTSALATNGIK